MINSFPADCSAFLNNQVYLNNMLTMIGDSWEAPVLSKFKKNSRFNQSWVEIQLKKINEAISTNRYPSLRIFNNLKQQIISEMKRCRMMVS